MAKYKGQPEYSVTIDEHFSVVFDKFGFYETTDKDEIKTLDGLVPRYIKKVQESAKPEPETPDQAEPKPEPEQTQTQRKKPGAKTPTSGK